MTRPIIAMITPIIRFLKIGASPKTSELYFIAIMVNINPTTETTHPTVGMIAKRTSMEPIPPNVLAWEREAIFATNGWKDA